MTLSAAVTRQYLKAMGIESWEPRGAVAAVPDVAVPGHLVGQGEQKASPASTPVCQLSVESLLQGLTDQPVQTVTVVDARILLLIEPPKLEAAGQDLLRSMLKAIDVDFDQQGFGYFGAVHPATGNVRTFVGNVQPSVIIIMANFLQSFDELSRHRAGLHRLPWIDAPVAVTMHPNALLDNPALKRPAWEDLKRVKALLDG